MRTQPDRPFTALGCRCVLIMLVVMLYGSTSTGQQTRADSPARRSSPVTVTKVDANTITRRQQELRQIGSKLTAKETQLKRYRRADYRAARNEDARIRREASRQSILVDQAQALLLRLDPGAVSWPTARGQLLAKMSEIDASQRRLEAYEKSFVSKKAQGDVRAGRNAVRFTIQKGNR